MGKLRITKAQVDRLQVNDAGSIFWDDELSGFGVKVLKGGGKTYVAQYRTSPGRVGRTTRVTIGRHGAPWTAELARSEARRILSEAALGLDPAAEERKRKQASMTVGQLCDLYLDQGTGTKKPSTLATDKGRIKRHIKPLLGSKKLAELTKADITRFMQDVALGKTAVDEKTGKHGRAMVSGGKGTAARTVGLLGGILSFGVSAKLIENNPVRGVERYPDKRNLRFLTSEELGRFGSAILKVEADGANPKAVAITRLLALTGARRGEIEGLKLRDVDLQTRSLTLSDSKTGQKLLFLNEPAAAILRPFVEGRSKAAVWVFENSKGDGYYVGLPKVFASIVETAGLDPLRIHDLRHTFASHGVLRGSTMPVVGALLGHKSVTTTQRYAHLAHDPLREAAEQIGAAVSAAMLKS